MRKTFLSITLLTCLTACLQDKERPPPFLFGLASNHDASAEGALKLAAFHVAEQGGLRNGRLFDVASIDFPLTPDGIDALPRVIDELVNERQAKALFFGGPTTYSRGADGVIKGAGPAAAAAKVVSFCWACGFPPIDTPLAEKYFGGDVSDLDPACLTDPPAATCNPNLGTINSPGYVFKCGTNFASLGKQLGKIVSDAGHTRVAIVSTAAPAAIAPLFIAGYNGAVVRTVRYTAGSDNDTSSAAADQTFAEALAPDNSGQPIDALFALGEPYLMKFYFAALKKLPSKPQVYGWIPMYASGHLDQIGTDMLGAQGIATYAFGGPSPGTFLEETAAAAGVPAKSIDNAFSNVYDGAIMTALAIYATQKDDPANEEIYQALKTKINDPSGTPIGYKEFAKAKTVLDRGETIDYKGVFSDYQWNERNRAETVQIKFTVVQEGSGLEYKLDVLP